MEGRIIEVLLYINTYMYMYNIITRYTNLNSIIHCVTIGLLETTSATYTFVHVHSTNSHRLLCHSPTQPQALGEDIEVPFIS